MRSARRGVVRGCLFGSHAIGQASANSGFEIAVPPTDEVSPGFGSFEKVIPGLEANPRDISFAASSRLRRQRRAGSR